MAEEGKLQAIVGLYDVAAVELLDAGDGVEMCGFAGAVDAHNPHLLPALHLKDTSWMPSSHTPDGMVDAPLFIKPDLAVAESLERSADHPSAMPPSEVVVTYEDREALRRPWMGIVGDGEGKGEMGGDRGLETLELRSRAGSL
jgi:hypothetical protein